jgi:hypothetical protein
LSVGRDMAIAYMEIMPMATIDPSAYPPQAGLSHGC